MSRHCISLFHLKTKTIHLYCAVLLLLCCVVMMRSDLIRKSPCPKCPMRNARWCCLLVDSFCICSPRLEWDKYGPETKRERAFCSFSNQIMEATKDVLFYASHTTPTILYPCRAAAATATTTPLPPPSHHITFLKFSNICVPSSTRDGAAPCLSFAHSYRREQT